MSDTDDFEARLRAAGINPLAVANFKRPEQHQQQMAIENALSGQGVHPLEPDTSADHRRVSISNDLTNKNNVNNGYTPDGYAIEAVPEEHPAIAIEEQPTTNGLAPSFATQDDEANKPAQPSVLEESIEVEEDDARAPIMPAPFYLKVDLFDNGTGKAGKKKSNQYKVKIHYCMEDGGEMFSYLGAFHPVARGFRNNLPEGYERDPFYTEIDQALDVANVRNNSWRIRPVGAKLKDENHHVLIYTAAIVFWDAEEEHPTMLLHLQGWSVEVTLEKRPAGAPGSSNLLAYGIWLNPDMQTKREVFEEKRGGRTLLEAMALQQMGVK
ncbi:hypothetical protein ACXIT0_12125 [Methylorubrum extorquens]